MSLTVRELAEYKGVAVEWLARIGVREAGLAVVFSYAHPDGRPRRPRLRTALRGVDGTAWAPEPLPKGAYWNEMVSAMQAESGMTILVEGESDCWLGWLHELPVVGIPGWDSVTGLDLHHLGSSSRVYIADERDDPRTFPDGFAAYRAAIVEHLESSGFDGGVLRLSFPEGGDLSDFHSVGPATFPERLQARLRDAPSLRGP